MARMESFLMDRKDVSVEDTVEAVESWIEKLVKIERKLRDPS